MNELKASIGVDFSLIGTDLHAMYEKDGENYEVLLIPSEQSHNKGISIQDLISDIKRMVKRTAGGDADTAALENAMTGAVKDAAPKDGSASMNLNDIKIQLRMAYLYIKKTGAESVVEYAFQLKVLTGGLVPEAIKGIVDVTSLSVSVWNTDRKKVVDRMALMTVAEYLGDGQAALPA